MTAKTALVRGHLLISAPILIVFAGALLAFGFSRAAALVAFIGCYIYWSSAAPRWRLWALRNVTDTSPTRLLELGAKSGLLWRDGSWFERTELRPRNYATQRSRAVLLGALRTLRPHLNAALNDDSGANALEGVVRHLDPAAAALAAGEPAPEERAAVSAFAAQLTGAQRAGVLSLSSGLENHGAVVVAALETYQRHHSAQSPLQVAV